MDKDLLIEQLRERYNSNPTESVQLLLDFLELAVTQQGPERFEEHIVQLLALVPETHDNLFDDADMITCVGEV